MTVKNPRKVFINLPVGDVARTREFFTKLGFEFNPQFSDDKGLCMVLSSEAFVMLLHREFFQTFTTKRLNDGSQSTEAIVALSASSRADVDALVNKAFAAGGTPAMKAVDHGFMYAWSFYDLDGHHWEVFWMDPAHVQE